MKIFLGADHRGFELKEKLKAWLNEEGHELEDCGAHEYQDGDDFVEFVKEATEKTLTSAGSRGILLCGSGAGVEITANKLKEARCSLGQSAEQIAKARNADDINVLAIASDFIDFDNAKKIVKSFLETPYDPSERHERRLNKIRELEG